MKKTSKLQKELGGWGMIQRETLKYIKGNDFRVFADLITYANKYGKCFPSVETIADDIGITARNVQKHLSNLEAEGWIDRNYRTNTSTMYQLYFVDTSKTAKTKSIGTSKSDGASKSDASPVSKSDVPGVSKRDVAGVSISDVLTDQLTDHTTDHNNSVVSVSVVNGEAKPSSVGFKLSQEQKNHFEELWRKYKQDGESKASALSVWKKHCAHNEPDLIKRIKIMLDLDSGSYMTNQMNQISEEYQAEKKKKQIKEEEKAKGIYKQL